MRCISIKAAPWSVNTHGAKSSFFFPNKISSPCKLSPRECPFSILLPIVLMSKFSCHVAANGSCKASKGYTWISEAVCTDGYDCKISGTKSCSYTFVFYADYNSLNLVLQTEMMSDAIDDALDSDEAEEETEELTNQVHPPLIASFLTLLRWISFYVENLKRNKRSYLWARPKTLWLD